MRQRKKYIEQFVWVISIFGLHAILLVSFFCHFFRLLFSFCLLWFYLEKNFDAPSVSMALQYLWGRLFNDMIYACYEYCYPSIAYHHVLVCLVLIIFIIAHNIIFNVYAFHEYFRFGITSITFLKKKHLAFYYCCFFVAVF